MSSFWIASRAALARLTSLRSSDLRLGAHQRAGLGDETLDCRVFDLACPSVLGEFATAPDDVWPDLTLGDQQVLHRLRLARAQGCPLPMPWSFLGRDRHTVWSNEVERHIETFILEGQAEDE